MLGVTALALDKQVDLVVVLAGTRISLWRQTFGRLQSQLDTGDDGPVKERRRLLVPNLGEVSAPAGRVPLSTLYKFEPAQVRRAIRERRPVVVVAMKHADHLRALGKSIRDGVFRSVEAAGRDFRMLVLDDEADDGSILDALVEEGEDPVYGKLKQIPRAIADLWDPRSGVGAPSNLRATYVAYTATPHSNLLQEDHNPLAPKDFVVALRTAFDRGTIAPRETTFHEPKGYKSYYTGGETFYRRAMAAGLCRPTGDDPAVDTADAVRGFLVASAIMQIRAAGKLGPHAALTTTFSSREEAARRSPQPRSMLIHPSASISDQFEIALDLLDWAGHSDRVDSADRLSKSTAYLSELLSTNLDSERDIWQRWHKRYADSAEQVRNTFDVPIARSLPEWGEIEAALREEIIPGTRVSVVNSDHDADDRPEYDVWLDQDGWHAPRDLSTIFISGNVMSRGITLEGLTTTLFLRQTSNPFADSQMQMQRWFGYRNSYVELCRVIAPQEQLALFAAYHDNDEALRQAVVHAMNEDSTGIPSPLVLQGREFMATGKIANLRTKPLCPGSKPFIRLVNDGTKPDPNAELVTSLFRHHDSQDVSAAGLLRGRILSQPFTLGEAGRLLDGLQFDRYSPGLQNWQAEMWRDVQARVESQGQLPLGNQLYMPPELSEGISASTVRRDCPYSIGAYFRLWEACLSRHVRGLVPTESPRLRWSMSDLSERKRLQPRFWIGIRYGGGDVVTVDGFANLPFEVRAMQRAIENGELVATWGSRSPTAGPTEYRGDEYFDYYFRGETLPNSLADEPPWRPVGSDGLILFHINQVEGQLHPSVAVGVCIPLGGPDQFAATVPSSHLGPVRSK
ncbi:Z1 domain-containing protein [Microterricola pindariensis]|nr:Z1 domain-containing protein [Microterricola pindariensis]